jgi:hypothetical protein
VRACAQCASRRSFAPLGAHRRGGRRVRRHGARARPRRHPRPGRRGAHGTRQHVPAARLAAADACVAVERPANDQADRRGRHDPRDGEGSHWSLCGGAGVLRDMWGCLRVLTARCDRSCRPSASVGGAIAARSRTLTSAADYIDESEVLTPADDVNHINKVRRLPGCSACVPAHPLRPSTHTRCRSCAGAATSGRRCAASPRARR